MDETMSDNEGDETMEDMDGDAGAVADEDGEPDHDVENDDGEGEGEGEGEGDSDDDDDHQDAEDSPTRPRQQPPHSQAPADSSQLLLTNGVLPSRHASPVAATQTHATTRYPPSSPHTFPTTPTTNHALPMRPVMRPEALSALTYDIMPTIAAPHSTSINALAATPDMRWVFSGGADGYIRKFNWVDTANGKLMLTVAQRHPFVDSVTKAGVLMSYWENEEASGLAPMEKTSSK